MKAAKLFVRNMASKLGMEMEQIKAGQMSMEGYVMNLVEETRKFVADWHVSEEVVDNPAIAEFKRREFKRLPDICCQFENILNRFKNSKTKRINAADKEFLSFDIKNYDKYTYMTPSCVEKIFQPDGFMSKNKHAPAAILATLPGKNRLKDLCGSLKKREKLEELFLADYRNKRTFNILPVSNFNDLHELFQNNDRYDVHFFLEAFRCLEGIELTEKEMSEHVEEDKHGYSMNQLYVEKYRKEQIDPTILSAWKATPDESSSTKRIFDEEEMGIFVAGVKQYLGNHVNILKQIFGDDDSEYEFNLSNAIEETMNNMHAVGISIQQWREQKESVRILLRSLHESTYIHDSFHTFIGVKVPSPAD